MGKNQEKNVFFRNVFKKYIKANFSVLMDKVICNKFKLIFKVNKSIYLVKICFFHGKVVKNHV